MFSTKGAIINSLACEGKVKNKNWLHKHQRCEISNIAHLWCFPLVCVNSELGLHPSLLICAPLVLIISPDMLHTQFNSLIYGSFPAKTIGILIILLLTF